jgi:hypothetical protein
MISTTRITRETIPAAMNSSGADDMTVMLQSVAENLIYRNLGKSPYDETRKQKLRPLAK